MRHDYHTHSTYSDGSFLGSMVAAAEEAEVDGVGIADHCNVSSRDRMQAVKYGMGFNLDLTYERRREGIELVRDRFDVDVYDAVEMDYDPRDVDEIAAFLEEADFDYAIGSVHELEGRNIHDRHYFEKKDETERQRLVGEYFDQVVGLVESDLFEIGAHIDLVERNPALRGFATEEQYHRVAEAFERSRTVPEINAGRVHDEYGELHPGPDFLAVLLEHDVQFTLGTDTHDPENLSPRAEELETFVAARGIDVVEIME